MRPKIVGIVLDGQVMVDMATHNKATGSSATMDHLRCLGDDIIELSRELNCKMKLAALALFDKVEAGFSGTGGYARQFVDDMSKLATDFFMDTWVYEAQLDSTDTEAFHSVVVGLQEKVDAILGQVGTLEDAYKHSKASFNNILATMCQEIHNIANQASHHLCNEYKCCSFDRIAQDNAYMDVTPFMSNVIQNVCTFDALLTSHQLGWSVVPLQIMMAPILTKAAATPCHLEFMQYQTERSLHIQRSVWKSYATPAPVSCPSGINLESEQENPGSSKPKTSDPDSPETHPTPHTDPPITPSKPPVMLRKPEAMPSKITDASLRPPAMPKKHTLMPQKVIPGVSSNSAKDILDHITAKYGSGMSPQYLNVLAHLTSGKGSEATALKSKEPSAQDDGDHSYVKLMRSDSNSDRKKVKPPSKKAKCDPGSRPEVADARSSGSKKKPKESTKKMLKSKKTVSLKSDDSDESEELCGKLCSQPTKVVIAKLQCRHTEKWTSHLLGIHSYHQQKGIIPESSPPYNFKDHYDYIRQLLCKNESGFSITPVIDLLNQCRKDSSATGWKRYKAVKMLSGATTGKSGALPLYMVEVFKVPQTKELITPDNINGFYSQIKTGLCSLSAHDAISKFTTRDTGNEKKTVSKCYCTL